MIKKYFGNTSGDFIIILVTRGDDLEIEELSNIDNAEDIMKKLIPDFRNRYQVSITTIRQIAHKSESSWKGRKENRGSCYTSDMFQEDEEGEGRGDKEEGGGTSNKTWWRHGNNKKQNRKRVSENWAGEKAVEEIITKEKKNRKAEDRTRREQEEHQWQQWEGEQEALEERKHVHIKGKENHWQKTGTEPKRHERETRSLGEEIQEKEKEQKGNKKRITAT